MTGWMWAALAWAGAPEDPCVADGEAIVEALLRAHPRGYWIARPEARATFLRELRGKEGLPCHVRLMEFVARLNDGHTLVLPATPPRSERWLLVNGVARDDGLDVHGSLVPSIQRGDRLTHIDGVPVARWVQSLRALYPAETHAGRDAHVGVSLMSWWELAHPGRQAVTVGLVRDGVPMEVVVQRASQRARLEQVTVTKVTDADVDAHVSRDANGRLVVRVRSFDEGYAKEPWRVVAKALRGPVPTEVVLDLRGNQGGQLSKMQRLLSVLGISPPPMGARSAPSPERQAVPWYERGIGCRPFANCEQRPRVPRIRPRYRGPVRVLVDGFTFSAAAVAAEAARQQGHTVVGEVGGRGCLFGNAVDQQLPSGRNWTVATAELYGWACGQLAPVRSPADVSWPPTGRADGGADATEMPGSR